MDRIIRSALISVFYKDGLDPIVHKLHELGVALYSTGEHKLLLSNSAFHALL